MSVFVLFSGLGFSQSGEPVGTIILPAKIRDFKEWNTPNGHPDFQNSKWTRPHSKGMVFPAIDETGQTSSFPMDHRNPKLKSAGKHFEGVDAFYPWYNDVDTSVNRPYLIGLEFNAYSNCLFVYDNRAFFPIDNGKEFFSLHDPPLNTFGHLQHKYPYHNYGFTMEFHTTFTYVRGAKQVFTFNGDDDVWVFINDSLVIDLGGLHPPSRQSVNLDELPWGFLKDGRKYTLDFFSAERMTPNSQIQITTSILFDVDDDGGILLKQNAGQGKVVRCYGEQIELPAPIPVNKQYSEYFPTPVHLNPDKPGAGYSISASGKNVFVHRINNQNHTEKRKLTLQIRNIRGGLVSSVPLQQNHNYWKSSVLTQLEAGVYFFSVVDGETILANKTIAWDIQGN